MEEAAKAVAIGACLVEEGPALPAMCPGWWWGVALVQPSHPLPMEAHPIIWGGVAVLSSPACPPPPSRPRHPLPPAPPPHPSSPGETWGQGPTTPPLEVVWSPLLWEGARGGRGPAREGERGQLLWSPFSPMGWNPSQCRKLGRRGTPVGARLGGVVGGGVPRPSSRGPFSLLWQVGGVGGPGTAWAAPLEVMQGPQGALGPMAPP